MAKPDRLPSHLYSQSLQGLFTTYDCLVGGVGSGERAMARSGSNIDATQFSNPCSDGDEFPRSIAKAAVTQLCESAGFHSIQLSALETLADIASRYLLDVGKASQLYANLSGRTQSNALDVIAALEDIGGGGLADPHVSMASSTTFKDLKRFVEHGEEIPFCKPVPHFPVCKRRDTTPSFSQIGEKPPDSHIPTWLPAFPDPHTYKSTPVWNERKNDPRLDKLEQARQRRKAERSLVSLHLRLCTSGASTSANLSSSSMPLFGSSAPPVDTMVSKTDTDSINKMKSNKRPFVPAQNPFLAAPFPADAKEVSALPFSNGISLEPQPQIDRSLTEPVVPASARDVFTPAIEAARHDVQETVGETKTAAGYLPDPNERMPVLMTFDFGRKAKEKATAASLCLGGKERKKMRIFVKSDEKDEKKRRAEQILAQTVQGNENGIQ